MFRWIAVVLVAAAPLAMFGGCPDQGTTTTDGVQVSVTLEAPEPLVSGNMVKLTAKAADGSELAGGEFRWVQTLGRMVDLDGDNSNEATFMAPSLGPNLARELRFRVDVTVNGAVHSSDEVQVDVEFDPFYTAPGTLGCGTYEAVDEPWPWVRLETSMGDIVIELDRTRAPITVENFLQYVSDGFYDNTIFHRIIADFVVQGGGFDLDHVSKETRPAIENESDNCRKNYRTTVAMARQATVDSATSQFFFNLVDNDTLDSNGGANGYTVFGRVIEGMGIVDQMGQVETDTLEGMPDVPVEDVILLTAEQIESQNHTVPETDFGTKPGDTADPNDATSADGKTDDDPKPRVLLQTSKGNVVLELDRENAPLTVNNFLRYVDDGFYDGTIFHRIIPEFVVQGGGFEPGLERKEPRSPIINESDNGLDNIRTSIAMARTNDLDSATSQFFINLVDNETLNARNGADGYAVFGYVAEGMDIVDQMAEVETESRDGFNDVPVDDVLLIRATRIQSSPTSGSDGGSEGGSSGGGGGGGGGASDDNSGGGGGGGALSGSG